MTDETKPEPNIGYIYDWLHLTEAQACDMSRRISAGILLTNTFPELIAYLKLDRLPESKRLLILQGVLLQMRIEMNNSAAATAGLTPPDAAPNPSRPE
jgi:hypothetical protein